MSNFHNIKFSGADHRVRWNNLLTELSVFRFFIDLIFFSFSNSNYEYYQIVIYNLIYQPISTHSKLYFVMIFKPR